MRFTAGPPHIISPNTIAHVAKSPGAKSHWNGRVNQGIKGQLKDVVFLMTIVLQITVFIKYNECQGICLVSTDARTYRQLCTSGSKTNLSTIILPKREEVRV